MKARYLCATLAFSLVLVAAARLPGAADDWRGAAPPGAEYPAGELDRQFAVLSYDFTQRERFSAFAPEVFRRESLILDSDRDPLDVVLRRTESLLDDILAMPEAPDLASASSELAELRRRAGGCPVEDAAARRGLFNEACRLRRRIAFANPLLDFDELLIVKRHPSIYNHMCDQYYGMAQNPGGGLFVLTDPFGESPGIRDVLADAVVENGRLEGRRLSGGPVDRAWSISFDGQGNLHGEETEGGSFLSPDLSFDGSRVAFAYVECQGERTHDHHTDPARGHWAPGRCYHVFTVNLDGSNLRMLTDGTWNDFDPCFMPSGRIAFISERRGGYLRCGRTCPTYTLYDMAADGSDIRCLSYHETNEWHPSVAHDGMIVWTRWDYVDRHGCTAQHPWRTTPDGRDPRAVHGNFSLRPLRPDMEVDVRAVPGSPLYVATAAPHHGQAFGSLVVFDPRVEDDDAMGPVRRVTPDVGFPETQGGSLSYGQAWPLSETYFLCVYEPLEVAAANPAQKYGVYLVDAFGNRELVYRDPGIACHNPIPVRRRPTPPAVPEMSRRVAADEEAEATVAVVDVYDALKPWPEGTRIDALRVYQIYPLSVASSRVPHATGIQIPQGNDSINLARAVLGTVPVEADGSAHFVVPARVEVFFQALDPDGLAVTSMRSATQFQPGERMTCQGCHEPKPRSPLAENGVVPAALRRPPSRLEPEPDGTNPFSYPRLVQPVLDRHCQPCHAKHPDKAPPLDAAVANTGRSSYMQPATNYTRSYLSLAPGFGFFSYGGTGWSDPKWYRTTPGEFGARASKLYTMLRDGHHDVQLPAEDLRRLTVWLDSCSVFYGVYEKEGGEAQLAGGIAQPTLQ